MTKDETVEMAKKLLASYGDQGFEISMPTKQDYELMRQAFASLGRFTGPDGEFFVVKVFAVDGDRGNSSSLAPAK